MLALLFFLSSLESVWMLLVIPVLTAITFLISWWVTETFVEQGADDDCIASRRHTRDASSHTA